MPDEQNKVNLDVDQIDSSFLRDIQTATEQAKKREASDRAKDAADAQTAKSRKTSAIIIAAAAVVIFLLSYWIVFGREGGTDPSGTGSSANSGFATGSQPANSPIKPPCVNCAPTAPPTAPPVARGSQTVQHPPDGYEQPSDDPGM